MNTNQKEYFKEYYRKNKEKLKERAAEWRANNPEKVKAIQQKWRDDNKDSRKESRQRWEKTLKGCLATKLKHLKKSKRSRVLEVSIDINNLIELWDAQNGCCAISKYPMTYTESCLFGVSVDRIDSSGGYTKENVQLVCQGINFAKNKYSNQEMIDFWNYRDQL